MLRILRWRWRRTYAGHLTMRERLRLGWMSWPIPKLRGRRSIKGFYILSADSQRRRMGEKMYVDTHLGILLVHARLGGRERSRSGLLASLGGLSLRRTVSQLFVLYRALVSEGISANTAAQAISHHALRSTAGGGLKGHHCSMRGLEVASRGIQLVV